MLSPLNVATPPAAVAVTVPDSVPPPGLLAIVSVTELLKDVTRLRPASCASTIGCVGKAVPACASLGDGLNTSLATEPTVMLKGALVPLSAPLLAASV